MTNKGKNQTGSVSKHKLITLLACVDLRVCQVLLQEYGLKFWHLKQFEYDPFSYIIFFGFNLLSWKHRCLTLQQILITKLHNMDFGSRCCLWICALLTLVYRDAPVKAR